MRLLSLVVLLLLLLACARRLVIPHAAHGSPHA
jgi:hypothetical protein